MLTNSPIVILSGPNIGKAEVESLNYDYIPGEPNSQRVWYFTLRRPDPYGLCRNMIIKFAASNYQSYSPLLDTDVFQVIDLHGRYIEVKPLTSQIGRAGNQKFMPKLRPRVGTAYYPNRPASLLSNQEL